MKAIKTDAGPDHKGDLTCSDKPSCLIYLIPRPSTAEETQG